LGSIRTEKMGKKKYSRSNHKRGRKRVGEGEVMWEGMQWGDCKERGVWNYRKSDRLQDLGAKKKKSQRFCAFVQFKQIIY